MQLIGYGEERLFSSGSRAYAIFEKPDGSRFHMVLSVDQLADLLAASREMGETRPPLAPPPPAKPTPAPSPLVPPGATYTTFQSAMSDDDDDDSDPPPLRIASTVSSPINDSGSM